MSHLQARVTCCTPLLWLWGRCQACPPISALIDRLMSSSRLLCPSTGKVLWERAFALNDTSFYPMKLVTLLRGTGHQLPALPSPVMDPPFLVFEGIAQVRPA